MWIGLWNLANKAMYISRSWLIYGLSNQSGSAQKMQENNTIQSGSWFHIKKCVCEMSLKSLTLTDNLKKRFKSWLRNQKCNGRGLHPPTVDQNMNTLHCFYKMRHTSVGNCRDSPVKVFKADHSKATGIQKLGQVLHLNDNNMNTALKSGHTIVGGGGAEWKEFLRENNFIHISF